MGVVALALRAEFRRRWRSWVAMAVLVGVIGGLVLASAAAGRRTDDAFPSFFAAHGFDAEGFAGRYFPISRHLIGAADVSVLRGPDNGNPSCDTCLHPIDAANFGVVVLPATHHAYSTYKLVAGRLPVRSDEVVASYTMQSIGVRIGTRISVPFFAASQSQAANDDNGPLPKPTGPVGRFRVVGFEASVTDFPAGQQPSYAIFASAAFGRQFLSRTANGYLYLVRLRPGSGLLALQQEAARLGAYFISTHGLVQAIEGSIHPQAIGWWILALLAALVGLAVVGQALARQSSAESEDYPTLAALGFDRRSLALLGDLRNLVVGVVGALLAVLFAYLLSPLAPLGEARVAELTRGPRFDGAVLGVGAVGVLLVVIALGARPALRASRLGRPTERALPSRTSSLVGRLGTAGAPPSMLVGVRSALERRSAGGSVPVGSALVGTAIAVMALCGTAVFGSSLSHLTASPSLYGDSFQLNFTDQTAGQPHDRVVSQFRRDPEVDAISYGYAIDVDVDGHPVGGLAARHLTGRSMFTTADGQVPSGPGQIALGGSTLRQLGAHVGSTVEVTTVGPDGRRRQGSLRVVGQVVFPVLGNEVGLGNGALFSISGYDAIVCPPGSRVGCADAAQSNSAGGGLLVGFRDTPAGRRAVSQYLDTRPNAATPAVVPSSLVNFGEAVNFPLIFGIFLGIFGAATLVHLLVVSVARRRRDVGLLRVVGFTRGQVVSAVAWQAITLALIGIVVGVPAGIVVGGAVWRAFADNLGVVPVSVVPAGLLTALAVGVLAVATLIAIGPAMVTSRARPGSLLRTA